MTFSLLIEHNMRNIFLKKLYTKRGGETIPRLFSKKSKLKILLDQKSKVLKFVFAICQVVGYRNTFKLSCTPNAFTSNEAFLKKQRVLELHSVSFFA